MVELWDCDWEPSGFTCVTTTAYSLRRMLNAAMIQVVWRKFRSRVPESNAARGGKVEKNEFSSTGVVNEAVQQGRHSHTLGAHSSGTGSRRPYLI